MVVGSSYFFSFPCCFLDENHGDMLWMRNFQVHSWIEVIEVGMKGNRRMRVGCPMTNPMKPGERFQT